VSLPGTGVHQGLPGRVSVTSWALYDLAALGEAVPGPELVLEDEAWRVFHKQDTTFGKPKSYAIFQVMRRPQPPPPPPSNPQGSQDTLLSGGGGLLGFCTWHMGISVILETGRSNGLCPFQTGLPDDVM
jgi:hypothetical protein